eukprot:Pgem_evm1s42
MFFIPLLAITLATTLGSEGSPMAYWPNQEIRTHTKNQLLNSYYHKIPFVNGSDVSIDNINVTWWCSQFNNKDGSLKEESLNTGRGWIWASHCSIALFDWTFFNAETKKMQNAKKGEVIPFLCDGVFCPNKPTPDCYGAVDKNHLQCKENQFCRLKIHERFGPWAYGENGTTFHDENNEICNNANYYNSTDPEVQATWQYWCQGDKGHGKWGPIIGKCTDYRKEGESCTVEPWQRVVDSKFVANPTFMTEAGSGDAFERGFVCGPGLTCSGKNGKPFAFTCVKDQIMKEKRIISRARTTTKLRKKNQSCNEKANIMCEKGLVCTGEELTITPNTCVEKRPQNRCYQGPWWDSFICPRVESDLKSGLSRTEALEALIPFLNLFAGEKATPATCEFWYEDEPTGIGASRLKQQRVNYNIAAALWPSEKLGPIPTYEKMKSLLPDPSLNTKTYAECKKISNDYHVISEKCTNGEENKNSTNCLVVNSLREAMGMMRPNMVWSLIHLLMHNMPKKMTLEQTQASQAIAVTLQQNFWCTDCRGFFSIGILKEYGMKLLESFNSEDHAKFWWLGHNTASEHVASVRGGHPWIYEVDDDLIKEIGGSSPYFMSWNDAVAQWSIPNNYNHTNEHSIFD